MFIDARSIPDQASLETDICILGAGAAGITIAREFIGQPFRVSVLESGGQEFDKETQALYAGTNIGLPYFPLDTARLRFFGGTTNHWGGTCRPFDAIDFEPREWIPWSGWPLRRTDLQPYYERAQAIVQVRSPEWEVAYWTRHDKFPVLPLNGNRLITRLAQIIPSAQRSFGQLCRAEIEQADNLITYLNANATELETDDAATTVTSVRVACLSGNRFAVKAKLFVLALGGLENPRLLLLSNKRQPAGLGNQHDLVGRFFLEHPRFAAGQMLPSDPYLDVRFYDDHPVDKTTLKGYLSLSEETLRREKLVDIQLRLTPVYDPAYLQSLESGAVASLQHLRHKLGRGEQPDRFGDHLATVLGDLMRWQTYFLPTAPFPLPKPVVFDQLWQTAPDQRERLIAEFLGDITFRAYAETFRIPVTRINVIARIDPAPNPDSRVRLGSERDRLGQPRLQLDWRLSALDKYSVRRAMEIFGLELGRAGLGRLQIGSDDDAAWPADLQGGWHHMGTTRMSADPKQGVVDQNCRVHGLANLFVAGSSVFPTAGSGTPTLTLVSLALRLADHLKGQMR
jgi:choline dehydrogenase-like flavoprotein